MKGGRTFRSDNRWLRQTFKLKASFPAYILVVMSRLRRPVRALSGTFIILLLLVDPFVPKSPARQKQDSAGQTIDWKALIPGIESALESELRYCNDQRTWIDVVEAGDVTGGGIPEALVQYCHMGAYTSQAVLMRLERGKPVRARFRGKDGKVVPMEFLQGASVRHGENAKLLPEKHAVYAIHWETDDSGALDTCRVDAFVWVAKSETFDANEALSKEIAQSECDRLKREMGSAPKTSTRLNDRG